MFIVWGFKARNKVTNTGTFFCPRENRDRYYEHKVARRWFTLFGIALIPLDERGDYVECTSCKDTYYPEALKAKTRLAAEDIATTAIRHVVVSLLLANGHVAPQEHDAALQVVGRFASRPYGIADLDNDIATLDRSRLRNNLDELGASLSEHGRESVLTAAVYLAGSDGSVTEGALNTVHEIGSALTMSKAHVEGVVSTELARLGIHR